MSAQELVNRMAKLNRDYTTAQRDAATYSNPDLTAQELQDDRAKLTERNRTKYAAEVASIRAEATGARASMERAKGRTPKPTGSTRDGWERAKMLLDSGRGIGDIVKHADADMLHGIKEWAPTWMDAQRGRETLGESLTGGRPPLDVAAFDRSVTSRWANLTGDATLAAAVAEAPALAQLDAAVADAEVTATGNRGGGGLTGALSAHYAGQEAAAELDTAGADDA